MPVSSYVADTRNLYSSLSKRRCYTNPFQRNNHPRLNPRCAADLNVPSWKRRGTTGSLQGPFNKLEQILNALKII
jgi:hypothetical protein